VGSGVAAPFETPLARPSGKSEQNNSFNYDPTCYLCPGNERSNGQVNPSYGSTFSFQNDFAAIVPEVPHGDMNVHNLLVAAAEKGICKVICFSPDHHLTIAEMSVSQIMHIIGEWINEFKVLSAVPFINYVQIFENKGSVMGCSNAKYGRRNLFLSNH
jgi:UDPglucose--hexose-1-phosphate uridylyltransferase